MTTPRKRLAKLEGAAKRKVTRTKRTSTPVDFGDWLKEVTPTWKWDWPHLVHVRRYLDQVTSGEIRKLMLFMPPRHGKTEMTTIRYPVWRLEQNPALRVILGAYNQTLVNKFSRRARKIARERFELSAERKASEDWETVQGGGIRAVGVGGGITGQGGELIVIDDPVKSREEADSRAFREKTWEWYCEDLFTRQEPGCSIILIQTRWHPDDLAGRILASEDAPNWTVVSLPAEAEAGERDPLGRQVGEPLCPQRFGRSALASFRCVLGTRGYSALYQQRPTPQEGHLFKRSWFRYFADGGDVYRLDGSEMPYFPKECQRFIIVDPAASEKQTADYTAMGAFALTRKNDLLVLDVVRERIAVEQIVPRLKQLCDRWHPQFVGMEANGFQVALVREAKRVRGMPAIKELSPEGKGKVVRATAAMVRAEAGQVYLSRGARWVEAFLEELASFTGEGEGHDDQVDVLAYAAQLVTKGMPVVNQQWGHQGYVPQFVPLR